MRYQDSEIIVEYNYGVITLSEQTLDIEIKGRHNRTLINTSMPMNQTKSAFQHERGFCETTLFN